MNTLTRIDHAVAFHDAECGDYAADLPVWERLSAGCDGPVAELGAGTGRVSLRLAAAGRRMLAIDSDAGLLAALRARAERRGLEIEIRHERAEQLGAGPRLAAVLAPMQILQLLDPPRRTRALAAAARALEPGGRVSAAILDESLPIRSGTPDPLPDVREVDGWVHSSLPLEIRVEPASLLVRRLRQIVSPGGDLTESVAELRLWRLPAAQLEAEGAAAGLTPIERIIIGPTDEHVGSQIVVLEAPS